MKKAILTGIMAVFSLVLATNVSGQSRASKQEQERQRVAELVLEGSLHAYQFEIYKKKPASTYPYLIAEGRSGFPVFTGEVYGAMTPRMGELFRVEPSERSIDLAISAYRRALAEWPKKDEALKASVAIGEMTNALSGSRKTQNVSQRGGPFVSVDTTKSRVQALLESALKEKEQAEEQQRSEQRAAEERRATEQRAQAEQQQQQQRRARAGHINLWTGASGTLLINNQDTGINITDEATLNVIVDTSGGQYIINEPGVTRTERTNSGLRFITTRRAGAIDETTVPIAGGNADGNQYTFAIRNNAGTVIPSAPVTIDSNKVGPDNRYSAQILNPQPGPNAQEDFDITQNTDGGVTITNYKGTRKQVVIPNTLYSLRVTRINDGAFNNKGLVSVVIPNTVTVIGTANATFGSSVSGVFRGNLLTEVTIPNSVTTIGPSAFRDCPLTKVTIPNSVTTIDQHAFQNCPLTEVTIPNSVTTIGLEAFDNCKLTSVTLGTGIRQIGARAFQNNKLAALSIPNGVTSIGINAFVDNPLTTLVIPASLAAWEGTRSGLGLIAERGISTYAFSTGGLTRVTLPANMHDNNLEYFGSDLRNYYISQGKKAGTYVKNGPVWVMQ